ncbi:hypothetical protein DBR42_22470 [Pelomonas sp. HMWF004]|nr:hypothetical protein DBR42_22470 [Pelomonas sp. HMWF004]
MGYKTFRGSAAEQARLENASEMQRLQSRSNFAQTSNFLAETFAGSNAPSVFPEAAFRSPSWWTGDARVPSLTPWDGRRRMSSIEEASARIGALADAGPVGVAAATVALIVSGGDGNAAAQAAAKMQAVDGIVASVGGLGINRPSSVQPRDPRFDPSIDSIINIGKQSRHVLGEKDYEGPKGGKSYFLQMSDAQDVLAAYQSGQAVVVNRGKDGGPIVRFDAGAGFNHSPGAGYPNQPTNLYWIKGASSVSVVPVSPTKGQ